MQSLGQVQGEDMGMKQEKYVRPIEEKSEHLAKVMKLYKAGNGQPPMWIKSSMIWSDRSVL